MTQPRNESRSPVPPASPAEPQELDRVVMLLRSLPDPQPSPELVGRILAEVRRRESRPKVVRVALRVARPAAGAALAAGLAGLAATTLLAWPPEATPEVRTTLQEMPARPVDDAEAGSSVVFPTPAISFTRMSEPPVLREPQVLGVHPLEGVRTSSNVHDQRLDHQLNSLLLDPLRFYEWLAAHDDHRGAIADLADRAAARGDATDLALQLRQKAPEHAMTTAFMEELFRAAVVDHLSKAPPR